MVHVLENLDNALGDNDNNERELGELTEKYELLAEQFEKEKYRRKEAEEVWTASSSMQMLYWQTLLVLVSFDVTFLSNCHHRYHCCQVVSVWSLHDY